MCDSQTSTKDNNQLHWFVMRAYKCEKKAEDTLTEKGFECFVPKKYTMRVYHGVKSKRLAPAIPSVVFVHATKEQIVEFKRRNNFLQFIMQDTRSSGLQYLIVPDTQMENFIKVVSVYEETTVFLSPDEIDLHKGKRVCIHGGKFDGVTGVFMQVRGKRNRRVVVMLDGVMAVAAEVHPDLIEILQ